MPEYMIKVRKRGTKAFWFLSSGEGTLNRLRVHAVRFSDKSRADSILHEIETGNLEYEGKVVEA